jgi:hypothetical protein
MRVNRRDGGWVGDSPGYDWLIYRPAMKVSRRDDGWVYDSPGYDWTISPSTN